jgi:hypothetical protein
MALEFLEIEPGGPMKVLVDNIGAIHLANNASSGKPNTLIQGYIL